MDKRIVSHIILVSEIYHIIRSYAVADKATLDINIAGLHLK